MSAYEALKTEIRRLARKEAKAMVDATHNSAVATKKQVAGLKAEVAELKREVASLKRLASGLAKDQAKAAAGKTTQERITGKGIVSLRARLGISQGDLATLCGVSGAGVSHWEAGRAKPSEKMVKLLVELRKLGKKDVAKRLASLR